MLIMLSIFDSEKPVKHDQHDQHEHDLRIGSLIMLLITFDSERSGPMKIWDDETPDTGSGKASPNNKLDMLADRIAALEAHEGAISKRIRRLERAVVVRVKETQGTGGH